MTAGRDLLRRAVWGSLALLGAVALAQIATAAAPRTTDELYTLGIAAPPHTSEFAMANDLATVFIRGQESGPRGERIRLLAVADQGDVQPVRDLLRLRQIDLAIVSASTLNRLRDSGELGPLPSRIVYLWRMPDREVHVLAMHPGSLADLAGKKVNVGPANSDAAVLMRRLFGALNLSVTEENLDPADAIEQMRSGNLAAMVLVTGKPAPLFQNLNWQDGFHLVPVDVPDPQEGTKTQLSAADYPYLIAPDQPVQTLALPTALIARRTAENPVRGRLLNFFAETILSRVEDLLKPGRHPKWRELDLTAELPGWTRYAPVARWLASQRGLEAGSARGTTSGAAGPLPERNGKPNEEELFRQFLKWREQQKKD